MVLGMGLLGLLLSQIGLSSNAINTTITKLLRTLDQPAHVGIVIRSLKTGKILYSHNAQQLFEPASTLKLFTASAALRYLKPDFHFKTTVSTTGKIKHGTLYGDVTFVFTGDPELTTDDLDNLIATLVKQGVKRIRGHVYLDTTAYDHVFYAPGWISDDLSYGFGAPTAALILNRNRFAVRITPANRVGRRPKIAAIGLPSSVIDIANWMRTTKRYYKTCPITIHSEADNRYMFRGCMGKDSHSQVRSLAVRDLPPYAGFLLKKLFHDHGIDYRGKIERRRQERGTRVLAVHQSPALRDMVKEMLKNSDNLTADAVLKKLGERYYGVQSTWGNSVRAMQHILAQPTHIDFAKNLIDDGAGLSRYDLVTPLSLARLLYYDYRDKNIFPVLYRALPIAGKDGTLWNRMRFDDDGRVHAKTGTMTGVTALAGYVRTRHNGDLSFVVMINNFIGSADPYEAFENKLCQLLINAKKDKL